LEMWIKKAEPFLILPFLLFRWRRHLHLNQGITVLQTVAFPLGDAASR
jgi:hypothetical protein